jgi:Txe/YoeB family toxin of Txe-Axe toxin-antitoxin module
MQGLYACYLCRVREAPNVEKILALLPLPPNGQTKIDYYGDFLVIKYGVSEDWGRRVHEHRNVYKDFSADRKKISMAWLFPAPVPEGF